jgi:hypothetical protein
VAHQRAPEDVPRSPVAIVDAGCRINLGAIGAINGQLRRNKGTWHQVLGTSLSEFPADHVEDVDARNFKETQF